MTCRNGLAGCCVAPVLALVLVISGCAAEGDQVPPLPMAVSNNAVAIVNDEGGFALYSFLGLGAGRSWRDITDRAFRYREGTGAWEELPRVPGPPRLASTAIAVNGAVYVMGGYTVAEDGSEKSDPGVYRFDSSKGVWSARSPMPVPVDDSVSLASRDGYIYLVSGWHDTDNVDDVQVYDTGRDSWRAATPFPGAPVFGHAGGMVDGRIVICDGVRVVPPREEGARRSFEASAACWLGEVSDDDPTAIDWQALEHHPGPALYRMGAVGTLAGGPRVLFAGGSDNPYNYDGIGYDGLPSEPVAGVFSFDLDRREWQEHRELDSAVMDLRGLLETPDGFYLVGGMAEGQTVSNRIQPYKP